MQQEFTANPDTYAELDRFFAENGVTVLMLVCGRSMERLRICAYFTQMEARTGIKVVRFSDFHPNPQYASAEAGAVCFSAQGCDGIAAVGGGSAMDVAKCIRLAAEREKRIPFFAMPTTAGSGSEATRFAVMYRGTEKISVTDARCLPDAVLFDADVLQTLPDYQKKAAAMDALCHAVESGWSVHADAESLAYVREAIVLLMQHLSGYLAGDAEAAAQMLRAANLAGRAINLTKTTAGHAMAYQLTVRYGLAHGHACALCVRELFPHLLQNLSRSADPAHLQTGLMQIAAAMGCDSPAQAADVFAALVKRLDLHAPVLRTKEEYDALVRTVNPERLSNHPVPLDAETLHALYSRICREETA